MFNRKLRLVLACAYLLNAIARFLEIAYALLNMAINYTDHADDTKVAYKIQITAR